MPRKRQRSESGGQRSAYTRALPAEKTETPEYNPEAEEALAFCEEALATLAAVPSPGEYAGVAERLCAVEPQTMTAYQRARLLGCLAEATYFLDDWERALRLVDEAILRASEMEPVIGCEAMIARLRGELLRRKGEIQRRRADFTGAAESYGLSVGPLWYAAEREGWISTASLRDSLGRCVGMQLQLGSDEQAEIHLGMAERAHQHTRLEEQGATNDAVIRWMRASLLHRKGQLELALSSAMYAAEAFMAAGPDNSAARILWVTLEIQLDLAEQFVSEGTGRRDYLSMAHTYHRLLLHHARRGKDAAGVALATLVEVRLNRLARDRYGMGVSRLRGLLEHLTVEREWDWVTISQARISLGRELLARAARLEEKGGPASRREAETVRDEAHAALELAVAGAQKHGAPGVTWWALRALEELW